MKKILLMMGILIPGIGYGATISSTTPNTATLKSILILPNESVNYSVSGTSTGTITLDKSDDGVNYYPTSVSVVGTGDIGTNTGVLYSGNAPAYYRWRVSTITAGSFVTELSDRDDFVEGFTGNKKDPVFQLYDNSIRPRKHLIAPPTTVSLSSNTQLTPDNFTSMFSVVSSTGSGITLSATPTITTDTAKVTEGTIAIFQSATSSITFQDDGTLSNSALELGASTRALGAGDILGLIYRNSKWWELFYANN